MTAPNFLDEDARVAEQLEQWQQLHPWQARYANAAIAHAGRAATHEIFERDQQVNPDQVSTGETK